MNYFRTALLLAALTGFFLVIGYLLGGRAGLMIAFLVAIGMNVFAYWNSDAMVLRMSNAREVGPQEAPELYGIVRELTQRAELPMPRVYIVEEDQPNAFATGRSPEHAAVAVNTGLLRHLSREEVMGVLSHELGHVKNRDTLTMTVAATLSGAIGMLATFGAWTGGGRDENGNRLVSPVFAIAAMFLAPLAASVIQMAISRSREFEADRMGAKISGHPLWLASALQRLHEGTQAIPNATADAHPAMAHLYIDNPLSGGGLAGLFSTHPPMEERIARLQAMAAQMGDTGYAAPRSAAPTATRHGGSVPQSGSRGPWG
ncbi:MAG TPA: zinc metalloprotease HtpX [Reyranella sp.]|nr:zinc metalloprotease HtpX [Reyranella sp.]